MNLLNEIIASAYYDTIIENDKSGTNLRSKISVCKSVFYGLFREITVNEKFDFVNNQSRVDYVISNYDLSGETKSLIVWLKKTIYKTLLKSPGWVIDSEYYNITSALINIIFSLSGTEIPAGIKKYSKIPGKVSEQPEKTEKPDFVEYSRCVVNNITKIETGASG
ncbi:MAG: hypothetical protein L0Y76_08480, partial [Ignavibacteria bacterium]|nr:hypothetical protein [Ignavibacteria bacterium]